MLWWEGSGKKNWNFSGKLEETDDVTFPIVEVRSTIGDCAFSIAATRHGTVFRSRWRHQCDDDTESTSSFPEKSLFFFTYLYCHLVFSVVLCVFHSVFHFTEFFVPWSCNLLTLRNVNLICHKVTGTISAIVTMPMAANNHCSIWVSHDERNVRFNNTSLYAIGGWICYLRESLVCLSRSPSCSGLSCVDTKLGVIYFESFDALNWLLISVSVIGSLIS